MTPSFWHEADRQLILEKTVDLRGLLAGKRVFLTGGTGFFGCWLTRAFLWMNEAGPLDARLTILTRDPDGFRQKAPELVEANGIELLSGDILKLSYDSGLKSFDYFVHAAAPASEVLNRNHPLDMIDTIVSGTRRALEFSLAAKVGRFLNVSSGAVYGRQPGDLANIPETFPGGPDPLDIANAYAEGKRLAELLAEIFRLKQDLPTISARGFAFVGPHLPLDIHFAIGNFIRDGLRGGPILIHGDGRPVRSYLYAADLAIWLWTLLLRGQPGRAYNVGSDEGRNLRDIAAMVGQCFTPHQEVIVESAGPPDVRMSRYVPCCRRAQEELNLAQWTSLSEAIRRTIASFR